ncbi:sucrase ferredoxin [Leptolyngbya sp. 'hensonii']|nr:sucrase ferredoxin [Leptolyngbya sp. 'hensonii']
MADCRYCSVVSRANGEDPIGTANPFDTLLVMEISQPWTEERLLANPVLKQIHDLFHEIHDQQLPVAIMAIAPDRAYSVPNRHRVMCYQRPSQPFAEFNRQEFLVSEHQLAELAFGLVQNPDHLPAFAADRQPWSPLRDIMVCTHGNVDIACARFGSPIYERLRKQYASDRLRVWRCSHFGGHQFAPTLMDLPTGHVWGHLEPEILDVLVHRDQDVTGLRQFYRGWVGLTRFEQMVEREIWMQEGWPWLNYAKSGQVLAQDPDNEAENADWAELRLEFAAPDGTVTGAYEARVEACGTVETVWNSGEDPIAVKQYRVSRCDRVA